MCRGSGTFKHEQNDNTDEASFEIPHRSTFSGQREGERFDPVSVLNSRARFINYAGVF